ncbi:hypothetical protein [Nocardioides aurantiacus]|uniref:Uncharacterized protein n=1 Tax=Nocardioides aurantiacus TaxID=86796 RepID=A0A3N2CV56_9ACTN|nr:hypothetical protein [Nocardioides aurantiacus]ROR91298.1 hypothetical protein EDD33_2164 [Nocardioides aurantiacus]
MVREGVSPEQVEATLGALRSFEIDGRRVGVVAGQDLGLLERFAPIPTSIQRIQFELPG